MNEEQTDKLQWKACGICHIGKIRGNNEDNLLFCGRIRDDLLMPLWEGNFARGTGNSIFAVMDGMGGESHGEWASLVVAEGLKQLSSPSTEDIIRSLQEMNLKICHKIKETAVRRIGSTVVIAHIQHNHVDMINIGDSRGYLWDNETLSQLSCDHTEFQSHLNMGFSKDQLHKGKISQSALTQHLGIFPEELVLEPYIASVEVKEQNKLLLCSDGLSGMLSLEEMTEIFKKEHSPKETSHQLLNLALEKGGKDNITIQVIGFYKQEGKE